MHHLSNRHPQNEAFSRKSTLAVAIDGFGHSGQHFSFIPQFDPAQEDMNFPPTFEWQAPLNYGVDDHSTNSYGDFQEDYFTDDNSLGNHLDYTNFAQHPYVNLQDHRQVIRNSHEWIVYKLRAHCNNKFIAFPLLQPVLTWMNDNEFINHVRTMIPMNNSTFVDAHLVTQAYYAIHFCQKIADLTLAACQVDEASDTVRIYDNPGLTHIKLPKMTYY